MTLTDSAGRSVTLDRKLGSGGEADIFSVTGQPDRVAKIYFVNSAERSAKLQSMVSSPPADPTKSQGHVSICWPISLLFDHHKACVGFLMHRVDFSTNVPVLRLYNPQDRQHVAPDFTWGYMLRTAVNICSVVEAIHTCGYVIGDLNESNFLVSDRALVTLVDCDSMQVPKAGGGLFRCTVGKPEFTAPELQGRDFRQIDRAPAQDNFALGVMIFHLLMEGVHPYAGVWRGRGDPPPLEQRIKAGDCSYAGSSNVVPMPAAVPYGNLPSSLKPLVTRCFGYGNKSAATRPSAREWRDALNTIERDLRTCNANTRHVFSNDLARCPWCERTVLLSGFDPFPPPSGQKPLKARPFVHSPPAGTQTGAPAPPALLRPPQGTSPLPQPGRSRKPSPSIAPTSLGNVLQAGLLGAFLLSLSGCAILPLLGFTRPSNVSLWLVGFVAGVTVRFLLAISRQRAIIGAATLASLCCLVWYIATRRELAPVSPVPAPSVFQSTGRKKVSPAPSVQTKLTAKTVSPPITPGRGAANSGGYGALPPTIAAFEVVPTAVEQCSVAIIRWTVNGAAGVTIDPDIGVVDAASGYKVIRPVETTQYTLTASGAAGSISRVVTVSVSNPIRSTCGQ